MANIIDALTEPQPPQRNVVDALRPEETLPTPNKTPMQEQLEGAYGNEFTKGFRRGALGLAGTSLGLGGQVAEAFGAKKAAESMFGEARRILDFPQGLRPRVETWDNVNDVGSFVDYGLSKAGEAAPSTLGSLAAAGVGGAAGLGLRAAGLRAVTPSGASFAAGAGSMFAPEAGEAALTMQNDPQAMARTTPMERLAIAGGKGAVNAALEFLPERLALGRAFTRPMAGSGLGGLARSTAYGAGESALGEAGTEAAQEFTGQLAHGIANPQRDSSQDLVALREAALSGAFGGAPMGAVAGGIQGIRGNVQGALARGADVVEEAQARGKLPTTADVATFFRRSAQEPEYIGEKLGEAFLKGKDLAKEEWETISDLAAKAATKGEEVVGKANQTLKDAIAASEKLDYPGNTENRQFLLSLQDNVGAVTKDLYYALKGITSDPTDARAQEIIGYHARDLATEKLPAAGRRSMDWLSRTATSFKRSVDKNVKSSLDWTDAKDVTRRAIAFDPKYAQFRGLSLSDQKVIVGTLFMAREAPRAITPAVRETYEAVMGEPIEATQAFVDSAQETTVRRAEGEYRTEMVKKLSAARRDMAALQRSPIAAASPELRQQQKEKIAAKYGLKLNEIEDPATGGRTEAVFDSDEAIVSELEDMDKAREGTPPEIEPPMDAEISQEVVNNSIQNLHYLRQDLEKEKQPVKEGEAPPPRAHLWVTLRPDANDPNAPSARDILTSFNAEDSMYTGGPRRKFTDAEIAQFTNEDGSVRLPLRPMSLSAEMQRNPSTKDALDPIRKGQTGGSLSRKGDLLMTGLSTLMNTGLKWTDSKGVEHKLQVEPEFQDVELKDSDGNTRVERRLPRNVLVGAAPSKKMAKDRHAGEAKAQTVDTYLNEKPAWTPRSAEALAEERDVVADLREKLSLLDSFRFKEYIDGLKSKPAVRFKAIRAEKAKKYIADAEQQATDNDEELSAEQKKEITNNAWRRGAEEALTEMGNSNLRATVNDGLKTVFEDVQALAMDRLESGFRTISAVDTLLTYLETNGEEVPPEVNALFRENNIRLFSPEMLKDPALEYEDGSTPQERYINQLEWLKQRARENERGGLFAQAEGNDWKTGANRMDETSKEVPGVGNTLWDTGSFYVPSGPVTQKEKDEILRGFTEYNKLLNTYGSFRIQSPGKRKFNFGFFKTEKDAREWLDALPEEGVRGLRIKVDGIKHLFSLDEASSRWPWQEFDEDANKSWEKGFRTTQQKAQILNPDTGQLFSVNGVEFGQMSPQIATAHLKELARLVYDAKNAKVIDATPKFTWTPPQPAPKQYFGGQEESEQEYKARVNATVKPASVPLTYGKLDELIRTREKPDQNLKVPLAKPEQSPQGELDLQDDVLQEENRVNTTPPPIKSEIAVNFPDVGESKQRNLDLFAPTETPEQKPERVSRTYIKAGLSGETTMNPMYLWKRSVVRARREQASTATQEEAEPTPRATPKTVTDDFGNEVRRDYRGRMVQARGKDVTQGKPRAETDVAPAPTDEDLIGFSKTIKGRVPSAVARKTEPNRVEGDIWDQDGYKIVTTNLAGVHGRGLAKQAADKGLITWKNREFGASPFDKKVITLAVKGAAPETARIPGKKWSESTTGKNVDLLKSELRKLVHFARLHPKDNFYLPYAGLGFGEGDPAVITPLLEWVAKEPNVFLISRSGEVQERYTESLKPGVRQDATTRAKPEVNKAVAATENEYSGPAMQRRLERDAQLKKEADEFAAGNTYVVENVDAHGGKFRDLTPEQIAARAGQMAELRREPSNKHDPNAIKVLHNGVHHTYVSREYTKGMVENRAKGYTYAAKFDSTGKYLIIKRTAPKQGEKTDEFGYTPAMVAAEEAQNDPSRTAAKKADEQPTEPVTTRTIVGENIASPYRERKHTVSPLGAALTNVTFGKYQVERVPGLKAPNDPMHKKSAEAWYKANRTGNQRKDMLLMQRVIEAKLRQYPELVKQIDERGGEAWIKASNHTVNGNIRWEGKGMESNFLRVLRDAYLAVKEFPTVEQGNEIWRRYDSGYTRDEAEGFVRREPAEPAPTKAEAPTTDELTTLNTPHEQPKHHFVPMKYAAGPGQLRPELNKLYPKGATMLRLVNDGHRTGTTRTPQAGMRKGDTFQMAFSPKRYEVIGFERVDLDTPEGQERWSQREGWSVEGVRAAGHGNQVRTGSIQMIFAPVGEKPVIKEQRKTKKKEAPELVGPPEEQAGPPLPEFVGPPTARDLGIFKKEQEQAQEIPKAVPEKLVKLIEKMFGKKVAIRIGVPDGKNADDAAAWYVGRKALTQYKKNMEELQKVRADRRAALAQGDVKGANDLREREEELLKQTQVIGLIYLSPKTSEAEQLGSTYHEAVHAMFDILLTPEERAVLGAAFTQGLVRNKLRQIFKDDPAVLEHMNEPEEAAAYAFQVWAVTPEQLPLGGKVSGLFNKLKQFLRKLFGILTPEERAEIIFNDMLTGRRAETGLSPLQRVLDKDMKFNERVVKTAREMSALVRQGWNLLATDMYDRLMMTENPAIQQIAQLGYTKTGEDRSLGMVQRLFQKNTEWLNRMDKAMKSFKPEAVTEAMEARLHKRAPKGEEAKRAFDAMTTYFDAMRSYFNDAIKEGAGNDKAEGIGFEKDYFPIAWDPEKVMKDREGFLKMLNKPEYAPFIEELKVTPNELWERISGYIIRGEKFTGIVNPGTGEPINDFVKERQLTFLDMNDMRPFLEDDAVHTMLRYTKQMVRHAEYIRAFGPSASKMIALKDEAVKKYGATPTQIEMVENYIDGLLGNREIGMPRELKDVYGAMVVYQNFRLLPFSLFSSLVDPLGIAVRSNRIGDAVETFGYAMRNLFTNLFNRNDTSKDVWERLAEDWGIIEDAQVLSNIHHMYESVELRGFSKRMNEALFKYNLLEGWVRSTKVMAVKAATRFIYRASQNQLGKDSERYLTELGLKPSDVVTDGKNGIAVTKAELMSQGVSEEQATQIEKRLQDAVTKFVNQAVLNPTAADLPGWGSNPYFAPIFHLKQFMFTFQNVIMARIGHEMERGNYKPLWLSTIFIPGMIAADALRGFVSNFGEEPPWQKDWGASDYLLNGVERSGLLGAGALFTGMKDDMMHGGTGYESLSGPTVEQARKGILAVGGKESMQNFVVKSMPLNPIYDQWLMSYGGKDAA